MQIPTLTTDRLILSPFTEQDVDPLHRIFSDPEVNRYFPRTDPPSREQVEKIIARQLTHWQEHNCGWWAVLWRESQELIGWCGLQFLPEFGETEVAYLLSKPYWGKGLATEAARTAAQFGFQTLSLERLVAIAHVENAASQRVIEKLGMSFVEQLHLWGIECYRYSLPRAAFAKRATNPTIMSNTSVAQTIFLTLVRSTREREHARLLIDSIRTFGGNFCDCPIWLFEANPQKAPCKGLEGRGVQVLPLHVPDTVRRYDFGDKVYACAQAEASAASVQSLIWADPVSLFIQPPLLFHLGSSFDAVVRPVHIRNVGLLVTEPLDGFWKKIYETVGVQDIQAAVESFVDAQRIRAYFNSHAFAVNPSKGLLRRWFECFQALVCDQAFQLACCQDERHPIFLHQAVLSALSVTMLDPQRVRILPPRYNYPYNLHPSIPPDRRAHSMNDLVSMVYEERQINRGVIDDIDIHEPLRSWLSAQAGTRPSR